MTTLSTSRRNIPGASCLKATPAISFDDLPFAITLVNHIGGAAAERACINFFTNENGVIKSIEVNTGDDVHRLPVIEKLNKLCGRTDTTSNTYDMDVVAKMKGRFVPGTFKD